MPPPEKSEITISFPYAVTIQIETTAPDVSQILLNGSSGPVTVTLSADNAGATVAALTVVTHSGDPWTVPLTLSGEDGDSFDLSNGGVAPCNLVVGSTSITAGSYAITISAPPA